MTANQFRKAALALPHVAESEHMDHPDFRVHGRIFATLWPDDRWGMVKLPADQQAAFCASEPNVYQPVPGYWGRHGATKVCLHAATVSSAKKALLAAWRNIAPGRLVRQFEDS